MKLFWHGFVGIVLVNLLFAAGFVGWMYTDGRINQERIDKVVDMFSLTIDEEAAGLADAEAKKQKAEQQRKDFAWLQSTGDGAETVRERLDENQQMNEIAQSRMDAFAKQNQALREEMARFKEDHARRVAELEAAEKAFQDWIDDYAAKTKDENFQQVVKLYESQPPKQTKQAFQTLLQQGEADQVVDYLAAMSKRKAAQVLSQFKTQAEVVQAAQLLEKLRKRGEYVMDEDTPGNGTQL